MQYQARSGYGPLSLYVPEKINGAGLGKRTEIFALGGGFGLELVYLVLPHGGRDFLTGGDFGVFQKKTGKFKDLYGDLTVY